MKFQGLLNDVDIVAVRAAIDAGQHIDLGPLQEDFARALRNMKIGVGSLTALSARGCTLASLYGPHYEPADRLNQLLAEIYRATYPDAPDDKTLIYTHAAAVQKPGAQVTTKTIGAYPHNDGEIAGNAAGMQAFYIAARPGLIVYDGGRDVARRSESIFDIIISNQRRNPSPQDALDQTIDWFETESGCQPHATPGFHLIVGPRGLVHAGPWLYVGRDDIVIDTEVSPGARNAFSSAVSPATAPRAG